ncbi:hypothetical protein ACHQM5_026301 [Ranunculus cassubicifolius]
MSKSGFCWADEVEKEEQEEYLNNLTRLQKSNPFGSARPREIVLQEKGVDWREIDQKLVQSSVAREEKYTKENGSEEITELVGEKNLWSAGLEENVENTSIGCDQFDDSADSVAPPLRYPPKNYMFLMKKNQLPNIASMPQTALLGSAEFRSEQHRENKIHELAMQRSLNSERLEGGILGRKPYPRDRDVEWGKENLVVENGERFTSKESGLEDGEWGNTKNDYERRDCSRERRRSPSINEQYNEGRLGCYYLNKEANCGGNLRNFGVRPLQEHVQNIRRFEVPQSARVDGGRVENHQWRRKLN